MGKYGWNGVICVEWCNLGGMDELVWNGVILWKGVMWLEGGNLSGMGYCGWNGLIWVELGN